MAARPAIAMTSLDRNQSALRFDTIETVPAGENLIVVLPEDTRQQIIAISFVLTTDATATPRRASVRARDGSNFFGTSPAPANQAASLVITYHFALCVLGVDATTDFQTMWAPLAQSLYLDEQTHFETNILGLQLADQITDVIIRYSHAFRIPRPLLVT